MKKFISQIIVGAATATLGVLGTLYLTNRANEIRYLDYNTWSSKGILNQLISIPGTDSLKCFLNNRSITNLSEFGVSVVNLGRYDLSDVPIFIELYPAASDQRLEILSAVPFDHNNTQESIKVFDGLKPIHNNGRRYNYLVHTFNREQDFTSSFRVRFLLEGDVLPNVLVQSDKAGIKIREYTPKKDFRDTFWFIPVVLVAGLISGVIGALIGYLFEYAFKYFRNMYKSTP